MDPTNRAVVKEATRLYKQLHGAFQRIHTFQEVELASFKRHDRAYYERAQQILEQEGFRRVADVEDETLSAIEGSSRDPRRWLLHCDGLVFVSCCHIRRTGRRRVFAFALRRPRDYRVVAATTELTGGTFVYTTTNTLSQLEAEPGIVLTTLDLEVPINDVLCTHLEVVNQYQTEHHGTAPIRLTSYNDILDSQARLQILRSEYRVRIGYVTENEVLRMVGPKNAEFGKAMHAAMQNLHQAELSRPQRAVDASETTT